MKSDLEMKHPSLGGSLFSTLWTTILGERGRQYTYSSSFPDTLEQGSRVYFCLTWMQQHTAASEQDSGCLQKTHPKTNMAPANDGFQRQAPFSDSTLRFRGCNCHHTTCSF